MTVWDRIASLMEEKGISSKKLAEIAGVVPSSVTKWSNGASIRNEALQQIAIAFGKTTDYLLTGREGASIQLSYGMREKLYEAKGATGLNAHQLAERMGVPAKEVEAAFKGEPHTLAFSEAFEKTLQPVIEERRKGDPVLQRSANVERLLLQLLADKTGR